MFLFVLGDFKGEGVGKLGMKKTCSSPCMPLQMNIMPAKYICCTYSFFSCESVSQFLWRLLKKSALTSMILTLSRK